METVVKSVEEMTFYQARALCFSRGIDGRDESGALKIGAMRAALLRSGIESGEVPAARPGDGVQSAAAVVGAAAVVVEPLPVVAPVAVAAYSNGSNGHSNGSSNGVTVAAVVDDRRAAALAVLADLLTAKPAAAFDESKVRAMVGELIGANNGALLEKLGEFMAAGLREVEKSAGALVDVARAQLESKITSSPRVVEIRNIETGAALVMGVQHCNFEILLRCMAARVHVMLVGEAGSSKTSSAHAVADALGLAFHPQSFGPMSTKSDLLGFVDAHGVYHASPLRLAFEFGGVFCADEIDAASAGALVVINAALANGVCGFPDKSVQKHPDFVVVACANTYGRGADSKFIGRAKLDAATLDRFGVLRWDIDNAFEASLVGVSLPQSLPDIAAGGVVSDAGEWLGAVQRLRVAFAALKLEHVVSMRATLAGVRLFAAGLGRSHVEELLIFKGMETATRKKVRAALPAA